MNPMPGEVKLLVRYAVKSGKDHFADSGCRATAREDARLTSRTDSRLQAAPTTCNSRTTARGDARPTNSSRTTIVLISASLLAFQFSLFAANSNPATNAVKNEPPPRTTRELFNAGTRKLNEGQWREAEAYFQTALARQDEKVRSPALYNLGHVRFSQGLEELKKSLDAGSASRRSRSAAGRAGAASAIADEALAGEDLKKMVAAYINGRGARRELRAATQAVSRALEHHGAALREWQRSLGDFKSALELKPGDTNAQHNAKTVERAIAKLVDSIREMQQNQEQMGERENELGERLKQLRGRIPADMLPPGGDGDEEPDEDGRPEIPPEGHEEGPGREGEEMRISPEQAGWLLEAFQLDARRRLPMGGQTPPPANQDQRDW